MNSPLITLSFPFLTRAVRVKNRFLHSSCSLTGQNDERPRGMKRRILHPHLISRRSFTGRFLLRTPSTLSLCSSLPTILKRTVNRTKCSFSADNAKDHAIIPDQSATKYVEVFDVNASLLKDTATECPGPSIYSEDPYRFLRPYARVSSVGHNLATYTDADRDFRRPSDEMLGLHRNKKFFPANSIRAQDVNFLAGLRKQI
uniref:Uncharacterized protein n=1 Tax=Pristionchus pacificus TaxID=54126 RepID=A0A8R1U8Q1_PRIPA|eukprot:PDM80806.1 hypothetical protein PRIPAC_35809 [Pristionchus pacificus]